MVRIGDGNPPHAPAARPHQGILAGALGCVLWFVEALQMGTIDGGVLRSLRGASWAVGAVLFAIYALAWLLVGRRTESGIVHRSYIRRNSWTRFDYIPPRRFATDRTRRYP